MMDLMIRQLRGDEGVRARAYRDSLGLLTIGVGRLIDPSRPDSGLRPAEIDQLLTNDIVDRVLALNAALPWFATLDDVRKGALVNMAFQLGTPGLLAFKVTLGLMAAGDWVGASDAMLKSKWATQTPERARRMAAQIRTGTWQFAEGV